VLIVEPLQLISRNVTTNVPKLVVTLLCCDVCKFVAKFKSSYWNSHVKVLDWSLKQNKPIKCVVYKLVCESHYELLNFATNLQTLQRSSEHLWSKFCEMDCKAN
jgi:hypothetical protein